jgi:GT2 family glycosyltransferase
VPLRAPGRAARAGYREPVVSSPPVRPTVLVVTWQGRHLLPDCLASLQRQTLEHDVVVVDNASTDGTVDWLAEEHPEVRVVRNPRNTGFAGGVQTGLDATDAEWVALLNNDAAADPGWLTALVEEALAHPAAAAVTSRMYLAGRTPPVLNGTGVVVLPTGYGADRGLGEPDTAYGDPGEVFGFSGGAALLRRSAVQAVGGFPVPFFLYYEDTDTSWRLRSAGWTIRYTPAAVVHHQHSASTGQGSVLFAFHNERNRLLVLVRCAPAGRALRAWLRFLLTTASLLVRRLTGGQVPDDAQFRVTVRLRVLGSAVRLLPWALRTRLQQPFWPGPASGN